LNPTDEQPSTAYGHDSEKTRFEVYVITRLEPDGRTAIDRVRGGRNSNATGAAHNQNQEEVFTEGFHAIK